MRRLGVIVILALVPAPVLFGQAARDSAPSSGEKAEAAPDTAKRRTPGRKLRFSVGLLPFAGKVRTAPVDASMRRAELGEGYSEAELAAAAAWLAPLFDLFGASGGAGYQMPTYPESTAWSDASRSFTLGYRIRPTLELSVVFDRKMRELSQTVGHHAEPSAMLFVSSAMRTEAALVSYVPPGTPVRIGVGLSLNSVRMESSGSQMSRTSRTRAGVVGEIGLAVPRRSRVFAEVTAQYRYVLPASLGPVAVTDEAGAPVVSFPRTQMPLSRWICSFGIGVRL